MKVVRVYPAGTEPDVEVEVAGVWLPGELRMWQRDGEGGFHAQVQWRPAGTNTRAIDLFPADRVREDTVDRSGGRDA